MSGLFATSGFGFVPLAMAILLALGALWEPSERTDRGAGGAGAAGSAPSDLALHGTVPTETRRHGMAGRL